MVEGTEAHQALLSPFQLHPLHQALLRRSLGKERPWPREDGRAADQSGAGRKGKKSKGGFPMGRNPIICAFMENGKPFAPPAMQIARDQLTQLFDAYREHTGLPPTYVGNIARGGDPKFFRTYLTQDFGFKSYDIVVSRFSAIWPDNLPWPKSVPRQAPIDLQGDHLSQPRKAEDGTVEKHFFRTVDDLASRLDRLGRADALPKAARKLIKETEVG